MKKNIKIIIDDSRHFYLESITKTDIEALRIWKNNNRKSFFYQELITSEQQEKWYQSYLTRTDDYIFMVKESQGNSIGCIGYRMQDNKIDLYNIIRGAKSFENFSMHDAMYALLNYLIRKYTEDIKCDVLTNNPAIEWYQKCGFDILSKKEYYIIGIDKKKVPPIKILVEEE